MTDTPFCALDPHALAVRMEAWAALDRALVRRRLTATGAELLYRLEPGLAERLVELVAAEAECCPGLGLVATVTLTIEAPEEMRGRVAELFAPG